MFCSMEISMLVQCVAKRLAVKRAAFADKTNQMTTKSIEIQVSITSV